MLVFCVYGRLLSIFYGMLMLLRRPFGNASLGTPSRNLKFSGEGLWLLEPQDAGSPWWVGEVCP